MSASVTILIGLPEVEELVPVFKCNRCKIELFTPRHRLCGPCRDKEHFGIVTDLEKNTKTEAAAYLRRTDPKAYYDSLPDM